MILVLAKASVIQSMTVTIQRDGKPTRRWFADVMA